MGNKTAIVLHRLGSGRAFTVPVTRIAECEPDGHGGAGSVVTLRTPAGAVAVTETAEEVADLMNGGDNHNPRRFNNPRRSHP